MALAVLNTETPLTHLLTSHRLLCDTGHCSSGTLAHGDGAPQWVCQRTSDLQCHAFESRNPPQPRNLETFEYGIESRIGSQGCDIASTQAGCDGVGDGGSGVTNGSHTCDDRALGGGTSLLHTTRGHVASRSYPEGCFVLSVNGQRR